MEDIGLCTNKMHLYLKNGEQQQRWLIVQLVEGHTPRVAGLSSDDTRYVTDNLEPAIWFKVMVLESISIDCLKRVVHWTNGMKGKDGLPLTYSMYGADKSCYDFDDDIDELFDLANYLIETNPLAEPKEEIRQERIIEYEHNLFRMLHCYILSNIMLQPRDIECVYNALKAQNKSICQLEDVTLMHSRLAEHYAAQMRNLREVEILPLVEQLVEENRVGKELLQMLDKDLNKAEPLIRREVDKAQKLVDHLKEMALIGANSSKLSHELADARRNRDSSHQNLVNYLVSKELVRKALDVADRDRSNKLDLNEACQQYMRLHKRVQEEKKISFLTVEKKIRAASVRECIEAVIRELRAGRQTDGDEMTSSGQRPTDVMDGEKSNPEWQTLSQKLSAIVHDNEHPIGLAFTRFCQNLDVNYRKILRSVENIAYGSTRFMTSFDDFYIISEVDMGLNKAFLEDQKNIILGHLYQVTELLTEHFSNHYTMFVRKIRLCYEKCFFNRIGRDLIIVYRIVYGKSMQTLEKRINSLREVEICKLGLQMKDEWWLALFEPDAKQNGYHDVDPDEVSEDESYAASQGEYGDYEDLTDIEEDEYCTDSEHEPGRNLYFGNKNEENINKMKVGLKVSKDKVLSRSLNSLYDIHSKMKEEITHRTEEARPRFDSAAMARYLQDEQLGVVERQASLRKYNSACSLDVVRRPSHVRKIALPPAPQPAHHHYEKDSFDIHFGPALMAIKNIFSNSSPLKKMQCLTSALRFIATKVEELRMRGKDEQTVDRAKICVTAEDLLPLLVLVLLKMAPHDIAKLYVEILFVSDLMADFLSAGCHSYALCEFQIAFRVLDQTCDELAI